MTLNKCISYSRTYHVYDFKGYFEHYKFGMSINADGTYIVYPIAADVPQAAIAIAAEAITTWKPVR